MPVLKRAADEPHGRAGGRPERRLAPALGWAFGGAAAVLAVSLLLYVLAASLGEWLAGEPAQAVIGLASAAIYLELAALFLLSSAVLFVAREFGVGAR